MKSLKKHLKQFLFLALLASVSLSIFASENLYSKLSPEFVALYQQKNLVLQKTGNNAFKLPKPVLKRTDGTQEYGAIIYTKNPEALMAMELPIQSVWSNFVTARITADMLDLLLKSNHTTFIKTAQLGKIDNDITTAYTGADLLHAAYIDETEYTGKGVLVCIVDTGIDWEHADFRDPENPSQSRIHAIWDQTITPLGTETSPAETGCNYGVEYSRSDINDEIDGTPSDFVRSKDTNGHGTHVAGTAAGNGSTLSNLRFKGMAPNATLLIVKAGNGSFWDTNIIDALNYARQKAQSLGLPIVVNMSIGFTAGPHDGTDAKSEAMNEFCLSDNGRILVVSAGNEGTSNTHISGNLAGNSTVDFYFNVPEYTPESGSDNDDWWFECWFNDANAVSASLRSPNGHTLYQNLIGSNSTETDDGTFGINNYTDASNADRYVSGYIWDKNELLPPAQGSWRLRLKNPISTSRTYHFWIANQDIGEDENIELQDGDSFYTLSNTASEAIIVANWAHRWRWLNYLDDSYWFGSSLGYDDIVSSSSIGPTRDERMKPDVAAPGRMMGSCASQDASYSDSRIITGEQYAYYTGTSMSSPVVAGGIALLLQKSPTLSHQNVKDIIYTESDTDEYTGRVWNKYWGYGKFNLFESMSALSHPSVDPKREVLDYTDWLDSAGWYFDEGESVSLKFDPTVDGNLTGLFFHTSTECEFSEPLKIQLWSDNNGQPHQQLGPTHNVPIDYLYSYNWNYISFDPGTYTVNNNSSYHIIIAAGSNDKITYKVDASPEEPRSFYKNQSGTTWYPRDYNFRFRPVITPDQSNYPTDVDNLVQISIDFNLSNAFPNPFNPVTEFYYTLPENQNIQISVFDIMGRQVTTLYQGMQSAGKHHLAWEANNHSGMALASGVYFIQLKSAQMQKIKKVMLIR